MLTIDKPAISAASIGNTDITIGQLLARLDMFPALPLVFTYDGNRIQPGYHITEVKAAHFAALDCGANPKSWREIFIQLWDVAGDRGHMPAAKFAAIIRKVSEHVGLEDDAKLTFEVSEPGRPMQLHAASEPRIVDDEFVADLSPRSASCKPRDRWLDQEAKENAPCCAPSAAKEKCCD